MAVGTFQRQQRQNALGREPLARDLAVWQFAAQPGGNRVLSVGCDIKIYAKLGAGGAGSAFADGGQRCLHGAVHHLDLGLVAHGFGQTLLQRRHIHNPRQRFYALRTCIKVHAAIHIAMHFHVFDGGGKRRIWPCAQGLQQLLGVGVECIRPDIGLAGLGTRCSDQRDAQPLAGQ